MSLRKIIFYPKSAMKPIILTDSSEDPLEVIQERVTMALKSDKISVLETESDVLIIRPSEIQGVLITKNKNNDDFDKKSPYSEKLTLDDKDGIATN